MDDTVLTLRQVQDYVERARGVRPCHATVHNWCSRGYRVRGQPARTLPHRTETRGSVGYIVVRLSDLKEWLAFIAAHPRSYALGRATRCGSTRG